MSSFKKRMQQIYPPLYFEDIALLLADRGWSILRVTASNPVEGHKTGFVIYNDRGERFYWENLQDLKLSLL